MTMELVSEQGEHLFNNTGWKMLIDLALRHGWKPAGALEPDPEDDPAEDDELEDDDFVEVPTQQPAARDPEADEALARAVKSVLFQSDDPVLDSYFNNSGFRVTAEDARALADALERALPDVPDHEALSHKTVEFPSAPGERFLRLDTPVNPYGWFSGKNKRHLAAFIAFCQRGQFKIW